MSAVRLADINSLPTEAFVALLGGVFEHSPWVAEAVAPQRPFADVASLHRAMVDAVDRAGEAAQLQLIRAHPELAGKAALAGDLTAASKREQSGAGLQHCSPAEYDELHRLNAAYNQRFGHPFILAVRGYDRQGILGEFRRRVAAEPAAERAECLRQIARIGLLRLNDLIAAPGAGAP